MRHTSFTKLTALLLAIVMLLPMISIPVFAEVDPGAIWSEDFTSYEGLAGDALLARLKTNWDANTAKNAQAVTEDGNTFMRFPTEAVMPEGSQYNVPIYVYTDGYRHWNSTYSSRPSAYDPETGILTFVDGEETFDVTVDTSKKSADGQKFGTFSYNNDGQNWIAATGYYAACNRFGDGYAVDKYSHIYFGECELYTENDPEVLQGLKKVGDIKTKPVGISYADHDKVVVTYKAFIEEGSSGIHNMQLNVFSGEATINGETKRYNQNFIELGNLNLATGAWSGGALGGATLPQGEWVDLYFVVDLKNGTIKGIYDGEVRGQVTVSRDCNGDKVLDAMTNLIITGWSVSKIMKGDPVNFSGALCIDDVQVLPGNAASSLVKFKSYVNDFEGTNPGDAVPGFSGLRANYKIAADPEDASNMVMALGNSNDGTGVRDQNAKIQHGMISKDMTDYFTLSADYYIPTGTGNQFQVQVHPYNAVINGVVTSSNWGDIYCIRSKDGVASIGREANPTLYTLPYDTWFTVTVEFQMSTNTYDIYVDGSVAVAGQSLPRGEALDSLNAASIIMAKQNKVADSYLAGTMYMDNIVMAAGEFKGAFGADDEWTGYDLFGDALTFDPGDNGETLGYFVAGHAYSFPSTLGFIDLDEDLTPDGIKLNLASDIVDETEMALDKMVRPLHVGISNKKASMAVLSANYTVSEDAQGRIESELFDDAWIHLFTINADASVIEGVAFTKGETFNVTTVMDFEEGTAYVYYNNLLINVVEHAKIANGLNAGEWSVAKIMRGSEVYAGNVVITDMTITGALTEDKAENPLYLYEFGEEATNIIETVDAASIRLKAPTGLRFATQVNAALLAVADEVGMIIAPKDYVDAAGMFTTEALDELGYETNYLKIEAGAYYGNQNSTAVLPTSNHKYITASIVNILATHISREFAAIGYYVIDGVTYYAENYTVRSIQEVAAQALESGEFEDTAVIEILQAYAAGAQYDGDLGFEEDSCIFDNFAMDVFDEDSCMHEWREDESLEDGMIVYYCDLCGASYKHMHNYYLEDDWQPVCDYRYLEYYCSCGAHYTETVPTGKKHEMGEWQFEEGNPGHLRACKNCPELEFADHEYTMTDYKAPTCGADGYAVYKCKYGSDGYTEQLPATGEHEWNEGEDCGTYILYSCFNCDATYEVEVELPPVAGTLTIVADKQIAKVGDTITVVFAVNDNPGVAGLIVTPSYDASVLKLIATEVGGIFEDCTKGKNLVFTNTGDTDACGMLVTFTFEVLAAGETVVNLIARECATSAYEDVVVDVAAADITAVDFYYGDVNDDGVVNLRDSIMLRNYLADYDYDTGESSVEVGFGADVNGDGRINLKDSILLTNYLADYDYETGTSGVVLGPMIEFVPDYGSNDVGENMTPIG